ncbi:PepSY-associated TM helix domain-containing protein [Sphingosinicella rhizophila]|uniref:PepSY-associated TM helix domain-containing protein n=1 Tax=Sphingosinicella rhizophila TaxID=3050082 RepID=A0ABU3Q940_9SPHN|nr:PepSY-associated TM helix domain-containing protein [Sphingosinicella sp. GR2756]MDT9599933.1 PepSY-associated TM helix domain-containing protein [Sphingosinicella sp. GR2756]
MKDGFRQSMAWLHTWSGLLFGWLLFVIFVCGTISYFQEEVTRWMQPEVTTPSDPVAAADGAARWLAANASGSSAWYITLPGDRAATTALFWTPAEDGPAGGVTEMTLDGRGNPVTARDTAGGYFLYRFHYDLHYLPVIWARYLVGIAAMFMLMAILSGIVTHKKIFADFFMLRLGKGQRSWLDAHNVTAVLALPFHLMITYTGLVTLEGQLSPAPVAALYANRSEFFAEAFPVAGAPESQGEAAPLASFSAMMKEARLQWGMDVGHIFVSRPGDAVARVTLTSAPGASMDARGKMLQFDGVTGRLMGEGVPKGAVQRIEGVMIGIHAGRYADAVLRWLYFLSGVGGTTMVVSGLVLWTVKRRSKLTDPQRPHFGFRVVERLNIAVVAGFPLAIAVYFLANRLLPVDLPDRAEWEVDCLFLAWLGAGIFAVLRPVRRGWIELCRCNALLFAAVPLVSAAATARNLPASLMSGDWVFAGFELMMLALAFGFAFAANRLALVGSRHALKRPGKREQVVA